MTFLTMASTGSPGGEPELREFDAPRLPSARFAAIARELIDNGQRVDARAVALKLLVSAERQHLRDPVAAANRTALAMALLAELRRRAQPE